MKKFIVAVLALVMLLAVSMTAFAADDVTDRSFGFSAGSVDGTTDEFGFEDDYYKKLSSKNYIEVRHTVTECAADYTNLIAAHLKDGNYIGSKWMRADGIYYSTTGGCTQGGWYAPCGRGNTKYHENYGITEVTISGQFRVH